MEDSPKIPILYIDDEQVNLLAFRANFRRTYDVHTATTCDEGKKLLEEHAIKIVVADQRMPKMTGVEFFEWIREDHPDTIRILLTGFSDISAVIDAINKGKIYSYITKPWLEDELQQTFASGIKESKKKARLRNLEAYYNHLFKCSSDAVLVLNENGTILEFNPAAMALFGYSEAEFDTLELRSLFDGINSTAELMATSETQDQMVFNKSQDSIACTLSVVSLNTGGKSEETLQVVIQRK